MKKEIIVLFLCFLPLLLFSQNIKGKVIEINDDNKPEGVPGVIIKSKVNKTLAKSDINGDFEIDLGLYPDTLIFSNLGFETSLVYVDKPLESLVVEMKTGNQLTESI